MFRISACVCAFFLLACCVLPMAAQPPAGAANATLLPPLATIYYGCVNNSTGVSLTQTPHGYLWKSRANTCSCLQRDLLVTTRTHLRWGESR
jgi:hypothetical protein